MTLGTSQEREIVEDWPKEGGVGASWRRRSLRWRSEGLVDLIGRGISRYTWGNSTLENENEHDPCGEWGQGQKRGRA